MPEDQQQPAATTPTQPGSGTPAAPPATQQPSTIIQPTTVQPPAQPQQPTPPTPVQQTPVQQPPQQAASTPAPQTQPQPAVSSQASTNPVAAQPAAATNIGLPEKTGKSKKPYIVASIAVVLAVLGIAGFAALSLLGGGAITESDLVSDSYSGVAFQRPKQWVEAEYEEGKAYVPEGQKVDSADQGLLVITQDVGVDYGQLNDEQKQLLSDGFKEELSKQEGLQDDGCTEVTDFSAETIEQEGYGIAFLIQATCSQFQGTETEGRLKTVYGVAGSQLHVIGVIGTSDLWDESGEALDATLQSMSPVL